MEFRMALYMRYDYWTLDKFFNNKQILTLNKLIKNNIFKGSLDSPASGAIKTSIIKFVTYEPLKEQLKNIIDEVYRVNITTFGYNLYSLRNKEILFYNLYTSKLKSQYGWHMDGELYNENSDSKFTLIINLSSKKYTGGKFYFFFEKPVHVKELDNPGSVILFKSYLVHKVDPVIKGERRTLSCWLKGPRFI